MNIIEQIKQNLNEKIAALDIDIATERNDPKNRSESFLDHNNYLLQLEAHRAGLREALKVVNETVKNFTF